MEQGTLSGHAVPQIQAELSSELHPSASSSAQAILSGGHVIAQFLKDVLNVKFQEEHQHGNVSSLRHRVPYGEPIPMHDAEALAMWESELMNVELICIDPRTDIPKVFGKGSIKLLEILDKPPFTHQFNLKINNQVTCKLEADMIFTYGSFGYGYSHQIKHPNQTMQDEVERSIFLRIPPPEDRRDSHYNVITPSILPPANIISSLIQQEPQMSSEGRMSSVIADHIKMRGRFLQMYKALEKCETGKEMVEFLERIILKKSPSWATNRTFKDSTHNEQGQSPFFQKAPAFRKQTLGSKPTHSSSKPEKSIASSSKILPQTQTHEIPPASVEESKEQSPYFQKAPEKKGGSKPTQSPPATKSQKQTTGLSSKPERSTCLYSETLRHGLADPPASSQEYKEQSNSYQEAPKQEYDFMKSCSPGRSRPRQLKNTVQEDTPRGFSRSWLSGIWSQIKGVAALCKKSAAALSLETAELNTSISDMESSSSAGSGEDSSRMNDQLSNRSAGIAPASLESLTSVCSTGPSPGLLWQGSCVPQMDVSPNHSYVVFSTLTHTSPPSNHPSPGRTLNFKHSQWRFQFFQWPYPKRQHYQERSLQRRKCPRDASEVVPQIPSTA